MFVTAVKNFNFSYANNIEIKHKTVDILIGYTGEMTQSEFHERLDSILHGELSNSIFIAETYPYFSELIKLDDMGIMNIVVVEECDDDFNFIKNGIELEFLDNLSDNNVICIELII